jgi:hypothetical protein
MLLEHSSGWLFQQMAQLAASDPTEWLKAGPVGFFDDEDPDYDPMFDTVAEPPAGWQRLPMHEE